MVIDSVWGGFGDKWMRLLGLYALSGIVQQKHVIIIPRFLQPMAASLFYDRIDVVYEGDGDVIYSHERLFNAVGDMLKGKKYVHPFHWIRHETMKNPTFEDRKHAFLANAAILSGGLLVPPKELAWEYQGFMEFLALDAFSRVTVQQFEEQAKEDLPVISERLHALIKETPDSVESILVFPSGKGHQMMPPAFAKQYLESAVFAFHANDPDRQMYEGLGLQMATYNTPEEMLSLGCKSKAVICTDSFPSHLWQTWTTNVIIVMSEQTPKQTVHPGFPTSQIVESTAPCIKCLHRWRFHPDDRCDAGHFYCLTWSDQRYVERFQSALARLEAI